MTEPQPLASCIMPTYNRRRFVPQAIRYFLRQDYEPKELIIVDDGSDPVGDLAPADGRVRYVRLSQKTSIGAKRNHACEQARGEFILHWDDDDWHAPHRLSLQVEELLRRDADVCGISRIYFFDLTRHTAWQYAYPPTERFWLYGNSLCYRREFWRNHRFADVDIGEDTRFVWSSDSSRMFALPDSSHHVSIIHGENVSTREAGGAYWQPHPVSEIRRIMGEDWDFYCADAAEQSLPSAGRSFDCGLTVALETDLGLPEFAAFNHQQSFPWMRRWELPYALFAARLPSTGAVLDCTINPAGFQDRLARLYPHLLYRHASPIRNGRFTLPIVPDEAFDCVFAINTLEHLLESQRAALIAEVARKLKPGGRLVLTSDYYFDSAWRDPAFLSAGVMRPDGQEVFNGWNRVTPSEWVEVCRRVGLLLPDGQAVIECPREEDRGLYRNLPPYAHAAIAGVFTKGEPAFRSRKVVLGLLCWNTRDISVDSVRAYVREAQTLRRLGHSPILCICDNGSSDGTAEALRRLEPAIDVPLKLILNPVNRGNSVARNQMIDFMLQSAADYLLLVDGDIEVTTFSSFAMLRHMEGCGRRLGCIGADSAGQTLSRDRATPFLYSVDAASAETNNLVAWTQYGMFRREVFEDGVRFDEHPPFDGPGWGYEDNDLAYQMDQAGYVIQRFFGMTYLHRAARSSVRLLVENGYDARALCRQRKQYVLDKWSRVPEIDQGPLALLRRIQVEV